MSFIKYSGFSLMIGLRNQLSNIIDSNICPVAHPFQMDDVTDYPGQFVENLSMDNHN